MAIQADLHLDGLGLEVNLREVAVDDELQPAPSWDLLYVEWQAMEPARDVWKLLGNTRWGRGADPELDAALEQLAQAVSREQTAAPLRRSIAACRSNWPSFRCGRLMSTRSCTKRCAV